jgi:hypothetical protein
MGTFRPPPCFIERHFFSQYYTSFPDIDSELHSELGDVKKPQGMWSGGQNLSTNKLAMMLSDMQVDIQENDHVALTKLSYIDHFPRFVFS